uniref:DUF4592 domain-containing protein n=1 Tax=Timema douglasi TaxID=61478 RepID=A0A7R8Z697_TIMDO|nr:unnamed protein product [Timema douglasi]
MFYSRREDSRKTLPNHTAPVVMEVYSAWAVQRWMRLRTRPGSVGGTTQPQCSTAQDGGKTKENPWSSSQTPCTTATPELNEEASGRSASPEPAEGKKNLSKTDRDSNPILLVIGSLFSCENDTFDNATTEEDFTDELLSISDDAVMRRSAWPLPEAPLLGMLPAEIQLKSASLPPGLALSEGGTPVKLVRSRSSATKTEIRHYVKTVMEPEHSEHVRKLQSTFIAVGEEDEDEKFVPEERKEKEEKKKDDSSFFGRLLSRRSGKKKKEKLEEVDQTSNIKSVKHINDGGPFVPKRIDGKGRYANESVTEYISSMSVQQYQNVKQYGAKVGGGTRGTASTRQRVEPINIPATPELDRRLETTHHMESIPIFEPPPDPVTRMEVSYSVSPPKPTWPEAANKPLATASPWRNTPDYTLKSYENIEKELNSKLKFGGLSPFQQNMMNINNDLDHDEREYTSLIHTTSDNISSSKIPVKKSHSFRADVEYSLPSRQPTSNSVIDFQRKIINADHVDCEDPYNKPVTNFVFTEQMIQSVNDYADSLEGNNSLSQISGTFEEVNLIEETSENIHVPDRELDQSQPIVEKMPEVHGRLYTKNVSITTRSIMKDTSNFNKTESANTKVNNSKYMMKKSSSLDSINSFSEGKRSTSPDMLLGSKKSSSTESISSYTQQVIVPMTSGVKLHPMDTLLQTNASNIESITVAQSVPQETVSVNQRAMLKPSDSFKHSKTISSSNSETENKLNTEKNIPSPRTQTPKYTPVSSSSHVPEFLRVQLNRVDSKPSNVVLSTNIIFDSDKLGSPRVVLEEKQWKSKSNESLDDYHEINTNSDNLVDEKIINEAPLRTVQPSLKEVRVRSKSLKEEIYTPEFQQFQKVDAVQRMSDTSYITKVSAQDIGNSPTQKQRNILLNSNQNISNKNYSVVSISSDIISSPFPKSTNVNLDFTDAKKELLKKQINSNFEDIKIVEKKSFQNETENIEDGNITYINLRKHHNNKDLGTKKEDDRQSSCGESISSGETFNSLSRNKVVSREFSLRKLEEKLSSGSDTMSSQDSSTSDVVLRKKSLPREAGQSRDEEPELLKVFARRSLKLKDSDSESLGQQIMAKTRESQSSDEQLTKSRDSDKENEGVDSPREERKKQIIKEPLTESKYHIEVAEPVLKSSLAVVTSNNSPLNSGLSNKYQRSLSNGLENGCQNDAIIFTQRKENGNSPEKRQRNRTVPESPRTDSSLSSEKAPHRAWASIYKDKETDLTNTDDKILLRSRTSIIKEKEIESIKTEKINLTPGGVYAGEKDDSNTPRFKRIQQRREEWEQRAQQAAKKTLP